MRFSSLARFAAVAAFAAITAAPAPAHAQDTNPYPWPAGYVKEFGTMWTFDAPPLDYWAKRYDFHATQAWLDHVRLSAVRLPGCSASFVSPDGLIMSNHHCARSCVAALSSADSNLAETGYVAASAAEEKHCPGMYADQLQSMEDVTQQIHDAMTGRTAEQRVAQRDSAIEAIQQTCEKDSGLRCQVVTFYQGGMYSLYRYRRFNDLRLVFVPEEQTAFFGGDPDNFTYPRFDVDISLMRAYEDGKPYHPDNYLKWSANGPHEGELVFVVGNPGSTGRLLTIAGMHYLRDVRYPAAIAQFNRMLAILKPLAAQSAENHQRFDNEIFGLENSKKAITGYLSGLRDSSIMARKAAFEQDFRARIDRDPKLKAQYGGAWDAIAKAEQGMTALGPQTTYYNTGNSDLFRLASYIVTTTEPDSMRLPQMRGAQMDARLKAVLFREQDVDTALDRTMLAAHLAAAQKDLPANDPYLAAVLGGRTPDATAAYLIANTQVGDLDFRKHLVDGGAAAVAASTDPLVIVARKLAGVVHALQRRLDPLEATISANSDLVGRAIFAAYGKTLPPDATFTLRISDGVVEGYPMNGTVAPYKTNFYGLYGRSAAFDDKPPFNLTERWVAHRDSLNLATPLDFVSTNDIIGGNSGSPVINRNAEVVGLIFDGNIEMLPNRFIYTDEVSRSVSVHSAGIIEALRKVYDANRIADEMQGKTPAEGGR